MNEPFAFIRLTAWGRGWQDAYRDLSANDFSVLAPARPWGVFHGLFGLASNELLVLASGAADSAGDLAENVAGLDPVERVESLLLVPTVRPTSPEPVTREGLYVFRFFEVDHHDVEEIVALSREAWTMFENTSDYEAEPQALFCQKDRSHSRGRMLLVTWYDGLRSWQTSRQPAPQARKIFLRRHQLTRGTIAYATMLIA